MVAIADIADIAMACEYFAMKVEILSGDEVIGVGELEGLDPPMGVAFGRFTPTTAYRRVVHAAVIDGNENDVGRSANLVARGPRGTIQCVGIGIEDFWKALGEIQVSLLGIAEFEVYFGEHPDSKHTTD